MPERRLTAKAADVIPFLCRMQRSCAKIPLNKEMVDNIPFRKRGCIWTLRQLLAIPLRSIAQSVLKCAEIRVVISPLREAVVKNWLNGPARSSR